MTAPNKKYPKISVVTPNYNLGSYLEATIRSVLDQGYPNLEYIIVDGGSTDNSVEIIRKYEGRLKWWVSEPDNGMYDAINKGFSRCSGEVMLWINSDDLLFPKSLFSIAQVFSDLPQVNWVHGMKATLDGDGVPVNIRKPGTYSYYSYFLNEYKWVQQEAVAWRRSLYVKAGEKMETSLRYAGDFELWKRFFENDLLYSAPILIGGFRERELQASKKHRDRYLQEVNNILHAAKPPESLPGKLTRYKFLLRASRWFSFVDIKKFRTKHFGLERSIRYVDNRFQVKV